MLDSNGYAEFNMPANAVLITIEIETIEYTIIFHENFRNSIATEEKDVRYLGEVVLSTSFTETGYVLSGWAETPSGEVEYANNYRIENFSIAGASTYDLYAVWTPNSYTITYVTDAVEGSFEDIDATYDQVDELGNYHLLLKTGYHFVGWSTSDNGIAEQQTISTLGMYSSLQEYLYEEQLSGIFFFENKYYVFNLAGECRV